MTWIVGMPGLFGYAFGISDVRVTLGDGRERDCLQKIYPVGRHVALGFAGSVRIGFAMTETLGSLLYSDDPDMAWEPETVSKWWTLDAREVFAKFSLEEQELGCHMMMLSTHPSQNNGDAPWAQSRIHVFKSPAFEAENFQGISLASIGSGTNYDACRIVLERFSHDPDHATQVMQGETGNQGGMGTMLGWQLTTLLKRAQPNGVSSYLHYCWVYRGKIIIKTNDHDTSGRWSSFASGSGIERLQNSPDEVVYEKPSTTSMEGATTFRMPKLAQSWTELEELLDAEGCVAESATT